MFTCMVVAADHARCESQPRERTGPKEGSEIPLRPGSRAVQLLLLQPRGFLRLDIKVPACNPRAPSVPSGLPPSSAPIPLGF